MGLLDEMLSQKKIPMSICTQLFKINFFKLFQMKFYFPNLNERIVNFTLKGQCTRFLTSLFFHVSNPPGPLIPTLKYFRIRFRCCRVLQILSLTDRLYSNMAVSRHCPLYNMVGSQNQPPHMQRRVKSCRYLIQRSINYIEVYQAFPLF